MLQRLLKLWTETKVFLPEKKHLLAHDLADSKWLMQVAYLADVFAEINFLSILMQSHDHTLVGLSEKLIAFKEKVKVRMKKIKAGKIASFLFLIAFLED